MDIAKFLHLFCGVTLTGANLAGYLYVSLSARSNQPKLFKYSLKFSFLMDIIACLMIFVQFASGTDLVASHHYTYSTHWIEAAYVLLTCVFLLICANIWIKQKNYVALGDLSKSSKSSKSSNKTDDINFRYKKLFTLNNILILIFIALIVHDAVMKSTFVF